MKNNDEMGAPKRPKGRPKGSYKVRPDEAMRAAHADVLNELAALFPVAESEQVSRRMSPAAFDALRQKILLDILQDHSEESEGFLSWLKQRPNLYNPQYLEGRRDASRELDRIIAETKKPDSDIEHIRYAEGRLETARQHNRGVDWWIAEVQRLREAFGLKWPGVELPE